MSKVAEIDGDGGAGNPISKQNVMMRIYSKENYNTRHHLVS